MEQDFAIVGGVNRCRHPDFDPLCGAKRDALEFSKWLQSAAGGSLTKDTIFELVSDPAGDVPRSAEFDEVFAKIMEKSEHATKRVGRRLYVFLAGHGIGDSDEKTALVAADHQEWVENCIVGRKFADNFVKTGVFREVFLFMDCCRMYDPEFEGSMRIRAPTKTDAMHKVKRYYCYATGMGRTAREREFDGKHRGIFSVALIEGLNGMGTEDGRVTTETLRDYVKKRVLQEVGVRGQVPEFWCPEDILITQTQPPQLHDQPMTTVRLTLTQPEKPIEVCDGVDIRIRVPVEVRKLGADKVEFEVVRGRMYVIKLAQVGQVNVQTMIMIQATEAEIDGRL